jgi:2-dehydropantoate 2-reductase
MSEVQAREFQKEFNMLRVAIVGAGAIGGFVGLRLALSGEQVTFIARGATLDALRSRGLKLIHGDAREEHLAHVRATDNYSIAGPQDLVILAMKAHHMETLGRDLPKLLSPDTVIVPMQNGIPFWYFYGFQGPFAGTNIKSVDPNGIVSKNVPCERVLGCVVYPAAELIAPGIVKHIEGNRFPLGEPDGSNSERAQRVSQAFVKAGLKSPVLDDIRSEIWLKLWGNLTFNPISALSRATLAGICNFPPSRAIAAAMMGEAQVVAEKLGSKFRVPLEKRIAGAESVGHHKTSMLQDVEAGKTLEIDALLGSVVELARLTKTETPYLDTIYALTKLLDNGIMGQQSVRPAELRTA